MQLTAQELLQQRENPERLEQLYRSAPDAFAAALAEALSTAPDALLLRAWQLRLSTAPPHADTESSATSDHLSSGAGAVPLLVFLIAISGSAAKLPVMLGRFDDTDTHIRNFGFYFLPAIAAYFAVRNAAPLRVYIALALAFVAAAFTINAYPRANESQTIGLAYLHLPFLLWAIAGYGFTGGRWRDLPARVAYLRWNGEAIIYCALIAIAGGITTALTFALFGAINVDIEGWYGGWVLVYAACAVPIVAAHLATVRTERGPGIAPLIARIFSPIALITLLAFLVAMIVQGRSPFSEREFLITFNAMLLSVLGIAVFCICERQENRLFDLLLCALLAVALVIDLVALGAIVYRLASFGWTPNRAATLVVNLLVFVHLAGTLLTFFPAVQQRRSAEGSERWIARFLPAYAVWSAIVVFAFPLAFRFR